MRTIDPAKADILFLPHCLTDFYFRVRNAPNGTARLQEIDAAVLEQIRSTGQQHKPHILNALRCWSRGSKGVSDERSHIAHAYPNLWASGYSKGRRLARFCTEALHTVNADRAVHMPYCASHSPSSPSSYTSHPQPSSIVRAPPALASSLRTADERHQRKTKVLFIGSHLVNRKHVLRALHRQNFSRKLVIINPFRRASPGMLWCDVWHPLNTHCPTRGHNVLRTPRGIGVNSSDVLSLMSDAVYTLCPAGDAPDSPRVYSALAHGSIPLIDNATSLPPLANWSKFSWRIGFEADGTLRLPNAKAERRMLHAAWKFRHAFECEASNPSFAAYIERSLRRIIKASSHSQPLPNVALAKSTRARGSRPAHASNKAERSRSRSRRGVLA